jgi:hypothetical protein
MSSIYTNVRSAAKLFNSTPATVYGSDKDSHTAYGYDLLSTGSIEATNPAEMGFCLTKKQMSAY